MKRFVLGDIHGAHKALIQCFERSAFDPQNDQLIFLGDVCDRGPETVECIEHLLTVDNLIPLLGNHDQWTYDWLAGNAYDQELWFQHGGLQTFESYTKRKDFEGLKQRHLTNYFNRLLPFHVENNQVFVHAGFDYTDRIEKTENQEDYIWDRNLFKSAAHYHLSGKSFPEIKPYNDIYIGHSSTHKMEPHFDGSKPVRLCNVWCMDQGAGWGFKLSMMNIETNEVFQSDNVSELYPL